MTWLPGLFHALVMACLHKKVFAPGGMVSRIAYCEKIHAEGSNAFLRDGEASNDGK